MVHASVTTNGLFSAGPAFILRTMGVVSLKLEMQFQGREKRAMGCAGDLVKAVLGETEGSEEKCFVFPVITFQIHSS